MDAAPVDAVDSFRRTGDPSGKELEAGRTDPDITEVREQGRHLLPLPIADGAVPISIAPEPQPAEVHRAERAGGRSRVAEVSADDQQPAAGHEEPARLR